VLACASSGCSDGVGTQFDDRSAGGLAANQLGDQRRTAQCPRWPALCMPELPDDESLRGSRSGRINLEDGLLGWRMTGAAGGFFLLRSVRHG
jgi:hypothetical protein